MAALKARIDMNRLPSKETVAQLRVRYPKSCRVELVKMNDPYTNLMPGDIGTVEYVDDTGTVFCRWDRGSNLGVVYGEDIIRSMA